ncbi:MAG: hypothetical protein ACKOEP_09345, partial [Phycisphaerales bacterium]
AAARVAVDHADAMRPVPDTLAGARVTVMGLGRFGGGLGVTKWLVGRGARVLLTDRADEAALAAPLAALRGEVAAGSVELRLGRHEKRDFAEADLVIANPAVPTPWEDRFIMAARGAGTPVTTEIRLSVDALDRDRTIGITGSAGKSSTSGMVAAKSRSSWRPSRSSTDPAATSPRSAASGAASAASSARSVSSTRAPRPTSHFVTPSPPPKRPRPITVTRAPASVSGTGLIASA